MTKKLIALALALLMVLAVFSGCAKEPAANTPDETEQPTRTPSQILDQQPVATPRAGGRGGRPGCYRGLEPGLGPEKPDEPLPGPEL